MIPVASRLQTTTSLLIPARAVFDLTRAFFHLRLGEAFRLAQAFTPVLEERETAPAGGGAVLLKRRDALENRPTFRPGEVPRVEVACVLKPTNRRNHHDDTIRIPLTKLKVWEGNVRKIYADEAVSELAASIAAHAY
jgi:hypothetical protein